MVFESEVRVYIAIVFILSWIIVGGILFPRWRQTHNKGFLWFIPSFLSQSISLLLFLASTSFEFRNWLGIHAERLSVFNSGALGMMAVFLGLGMIFMAIGTVTSVQYATHISTGGDPKKWWQWD